MIQIDNIEDFMLVEEPSTPAQFERLSPLQKNTLILQRELREGWEAGEQYKVIDCLEALGFDPLGAYGDDVCSCLPNQVVIQEANQRVEKVTSNFHLIRETLRGKIYECDKCDCQLLTDSPPCKLNAKLEEVRADKNLAPAGKGHDITVLIGKEDCSRCPKG